MAAIFVLSEKGLWKDCPNKRVDFSKAEHRAADVLKLNPRGQVPAFKDGEVVVNDVWAMGLYIEEKYGDKGTRLLPTDVDKRAAAYQRLIEMTSLDAAIRPIFMYLFKTKQEDIDKAHMTEMFHTAHEEFDRWNGYLEGKSYLCGDQFTLPDAFLYTALVTLSSNGGNLDRWPSLKASYELVSKRQGAIDCTPPQWKDSPPSNMLKGLGE